MKGRTVVALVVVTLVALGAVQLATASSRSAARHCCGTRVSGGSIVAVKMYGEGDANNDGAPMSGRRWAPIPAAYDDGSVLSLKFRVAAGHRAFFRATLSGDAWCTGSSQGACQVRVVVNGAGQSMVPRSTDLGHVMASADDAQYAASSVQFYTPRSYPPGTYTITAQASFQDGDGMNFLTNLFTVDEILAR